MVFWLKVGYCDKHPMMTFFQIFISDVFFFCIPTGHEIVTTGDELVTTGDAEGIPWCLNSKVP